MLILDFLATPMSFIEDCTGFIFVDNDFEIFEGGLIIDGVCVFDALSVSKFGVILNRRSGETIFFAGM